MGKRKKKEENKKRKRKKRKKERKRRGSRKKERQRGHIIFCKYTLKMKIQKPLGRKHYEEKLFFLKIRINL